MLGAQIGEGHGKRTGRRVLATNPLKVEASAEETTTLLGVPGMSIITYTAQLKPDGSVEGEGDGVFMSPEGELVTWKGIGVGRMAGGSIQYCGSLSFTTTSKKLAQLNGVAGVFQFDIDAQGNTNSQVWEMAPAGASKATGA
jgi:hypothetical protein